MYIDAIDSDAFSDFKTFQTTGVINNSPVTILNEKQAISIAQHKISKVATPLKYDPIKPMMQKVSIEYEHTWENGSADKLKVEVDFKKDNPSESPPQNEVENKTEKDETTSIQN